LPRPTLPCLALLCPGCLESPHGTSPRFALPGLCRQRPGYSKSIILSPTKSRQGGGDWYSSCFVGSSCRPASPRLTMTRRVGSRSLHSTTTCPGIRLLEGCTALLLSCLAPAVGALLPNADFSIAPFICIDSLIARLYFFINKNQAFAPEVALLKYFNCYSVLLPSCRTATYIFSEAKWKLP
jgi:hypothetical protein